MSTEFHSEMTKKLREILGSDGKLPTYAWPGGYSFVYYTEQGEEMCPDCANIEFSDPHLGFGDPPTDYDVHYEGPPVQCVGCNLMIPSEYGDPENPDSDD